MPDVILKPLVGGVEGLADRHGEVLPGSMIDGNLRPRNGEIDSDAHSPAPGMLPGAVHHHATALDAVEEVRQLLGPFVDVLGKSRGQQVSLVHQFQRNGHRPPFGERIALYRDRKCVPN